LCFGEIWGIDVSPTMIERGLALCRIREAKFVLGNGYDLSGVPDGYFDFCFSYNVLGYVPDNQIALGYLPEVHRVLKPGGLFQLHLRKSIPLKARTLIALPGVIRPHVRAAYHRISERFRRRPNAGATVKRPTAFLGNLKTWHGATLSPRRVVRRLEELGLVEIDILADGSPRTDGSFFWVLGQKSRRVMTQVGLAIPRLPLGKPGTVGSV
jgi:ubiquinone/menaquinone biosynthesis C-methylase UbiE